MAKKLIDYFPRQIKIDYLMKTKLFNLKKLKIMEKKQLDEYFESALQVKGFKL